MKRLIGGVLLISFQPAQLLADDMQEWVMPPRTHIAAAGWSGPYVGLHGGIGRSEHRISSLTPAPAFPLGFIHPVVKTSGFVGGSHAGYNWQHGFTVVGVEAEMTGSTLSGRSRSPSSVQPGVSTLQERSLAGIAAISGRLGYAIGDWLLFAKGGWAWGRFSSETITSNGTGGTQAFGDEYRGGWLVGTGAEYRFAPRTSLRVEYNFLNFGTERSTVTEFGAVTGGQRFARTDDVQSHIFKIGISHRY